MEKFRYFGSVINGRGRHTELGVPGKSELPQAPEDWPEALAPGSLNFLVADDGYPPQHAAFGKADSVTALDSGFLPPAFTINQNQFRNNKINPTTSQPNRGLGQIWRAELRVNEHRISCWVLRRIGSGLRRELELVSQEEIRDKYGLSRRQNWPGVVFVESKSDAA